MCTDRTEVRWWPADAPPPDGPAVEARYVRPKGIRGDLDNYVKAVLDAGNGVLWEDDRLVVQILARFS